MPTNVTATSRTRMLSLGGGIALLLVLVVTCYFVYSRPSVATNDPARDRADIEAVCRKLIEALRDNKPDVALSLVTEAARSKITPAESREQLGAWAGPSFTFQIDQVNVNGDYGTVNVVLREVNKTTPFTLLFRREKPAQWRVKGLKIVDEGFAFNIDLEDPTKSGIDGESFADMGKGMMEGMAANFESGMEGMFTGQPQKRDHDAHALRSLSAEQFAADWQQDLEANDQPASDVLAELVQKYDLQLKLTPTQEKALTKPISLKLQAQSRWQILDEVVRQVGHYPVYEMRMGPAQSELRLTLRPLPRLWPATFTGPYLVEVGNVLEFPQNGVGVLNVQTYSAHQNEGVLAPLSHAWKRFLIDEVIDSQGRDLNGLAADGSLGYSRLPMSGEFSFEIPIINLLRDVNVIKSCRGKMRVLLPAKVEEFRFDPLTDGATHKNGDIEITYKGKDQRDSTFNGKPIESWSLKFTAKGVKSENVVFAAYDSKNELIGMTSNGFSGFSEAGPNGIPKEVNFDQAVQGKTPASVVAKVIVETQPVEYDFHIEDIPLVADARKPEKIVPATFPGHDAPFSVTLVSITDRSNFAKAQFRIENHSDKDLRMIDVKLEYQDASGKKLRDWPSATYMAQSQSAGELPIAVEKGGTKTVEMNTPFLPAGTARVVATPHKGTFADATSWELKNEGQQAIPK